MMEDTIYLLKNNGVGVILTDTIYGLVGSAMSKKVVDRIYKLKQRNENKSLIILISSIDDLKKFDVKITDKAKSFMQQYWPGKVSIILPFTNTKYEYLDKVGDNTLAFRIPNKDDLIAIIKETGPLVAPSANPEGMPPAKKISEAKKYFGEDVDFYFDEGEAISLPSTLVKIDGEKIDILRQGAVKIVI